MSEEITPICIIHIDEYGYTEYLSEDGAALLVIDERCPNDRVFLTGKKITREITSRLIGTSEIGSSQDQRHAAISARIISAIDGDKHLSAVSDRDQD